MSNIPFLLQLLETELDADTGDAGLEFDTKILLKMLGRSGTSVVLHRGLDGKLVGVFMQTASNVRVIARSLAAIALAIMEKGVPKGATF